MTFNRGPMEKAIPAGIQNAGGNSLPEDTLLRNPWRTCSQGP